MKYVAKILMLMPFLSVLHSAALLTNPSEPTVSKVSNSSETAKPMKIVIIVGSVRDTSTGKDIALAIQKIADKNERVKTEIACLSSYKLPLYTDAVAPASRKDDITDPALKRWSEIIAQADGYVIVAPEYNGGYPGPLKNALDSLYVEWSEKPVAIVAYSGGASGGESLVSQLRHVVGVGLRMTPVATDIKIPFSWKAFDAQGSILKPHFEQDVNSIIDELLRARK